MRFMKSTLSARTFGLTAALLVSSIVLPSMSMAAKAPTSTAVAAPAAVVTTKKSPAEQFRDIGAVLAGKLRIGLSVNTASKLSGINVIDDGKNVGSIDANVGNTPAVDIQWAQRLYNGPGYTKYDWFVGATFERERTLSSGELRASGSAASQAINFIGAKPTFHANLLTAGIRWTPTELVYVPVGFNYGFLSQANWGSGGTFDVSPSVGLSAGVGLRLSPAFELEAVYKLARYSFTGRPSDFATTNTYFDGNVELNGVVVGGRYVF